MRIRSIALERCCGGTGFPAMQKLALAIVVLLILGVLAFFASMIWLSVPPAPSRDGAAPRPAEVRAAPGGNRPEAVAGASGMLIPVAGIRPEQLTDTYTQARAGGARIHDAIDIMAPRGTPVVAAAEGRIEKLFFSNGGGGITAYVRSPDGVWIYYYAHLDGYAPGLAEGRQINRGDPIGFVGSTGNASEAGPHLHFAIMRMSPTDHWWQGTPINPYPLLAGRGPRR
jgi:murein DD-endopeptidase MepM/ murein hydrolase activator NlpD